MPGICKKSSFVAAYPVDTRNRIGYGLVMSNTNTSSGPKIEILNTLSGAAIMPCTVPDPARGARCYKDGFQAGFMRADGSMCGGRFFIDKADALAYLGH